MLNGRRDDGLNWTGTILLAVTLCKPALEINAAVCTLGGYRVAQGDASRKMVRDGRAALAALPLRMSGCAGSMQDQAFVWVQGCAQSGGLDAACANPAPFPRASH